MKDLLVGTLVVLGCVYVFYLALTYFWLPFAISHTKARKVVREKARDIERSIRSSLGGDDEV